MTKEKLYKYFSKLNDVRDKAFEYHIDDKTVTKEEFIQTNNYFDYVLTTKGVIEGMKDTSKTVYFDTDSIVHAKDLNVVWSARGNGKTVAEIQIRRERIETLRGKLFELTDEEKTYLLYDLYIVQDYLLSRLQHSESERFKV